MSRAVRSLSIVGALVILGGIGLALASPSKDHGRPLSGALASLDTSLVGGWRDVARLTPDDLSSGRIKALDLVGDSLFVLQANAWSLVVDGELRGTFGSALTGAPEYLARAEGIAFEDSLVAVLDAPRHRITLWSLSGQRLGDRRVEMPSRGVLLHQALTPSPGGAILTSWSSSDSGGRWLLTRPLADRTDTLVYSEGQRTGESFNQPFVLPRRDSSSLLLDADSWRIRRVSADHRVEDQGQRSDAPHFAVPAPLARRMRERIAVLPEAQRRDYLFAEALPSLRAATITENGQLLVLTVRDDESTIAELVAPDGRAIASLWVRPDSNRIFAVRGQLLRLRELDAETVIERLILRSHD